MTAWELMDGLGEVEEEMLWPALNIKTHRSYRRALRIALVAAAVLVLLALAALAASESGLLERFFPGRYDLISDFVYHEAVTVENDTLRLTLHEAVTDGFYGLLAFSVERLDGGEMEGWSLDGKFTPMNEEGWPIQYGGSWTENLTTGEETLSRRWFVWITYARTDLHRISVQLDGLRRSDTGERLRTESLTAEAELILCPVKTATRVGAADGKELYPTIVVSPLSFYAGILQNLNGMTPENAPKQPSSRTIGGPAERRVELLFKDGRSLDVSDKILRRDSAESSFGTTSLYGVFEELLDLDRVRAVRIEGEEFPLKYGEVPSPRHGLSGVPILESMRAWAYGSHEPVHPDLRAEAGEFSLALDGIWTDGRTTELLLDISAPREEKYWQLVCNGGAITFAAEDAKGRPLAVGVMPGGLFNLMTLAVTCSDRAARLTIGDGDAVLVIPLDMKELSRMPQIEPREADPKWMMPTAP